jgi:hypothetical protein
MKVVGVMRQARKQRSALVIVGLALVAAAVGTGPATATRAETGKLALHAELSWRGQDVDCPAGTQSSGSSVSCSIHQGSGLVPGLGAVSETYLFLRESGTTACPTGYRVLGVNARFTIGTKGAIDISVADSSDCLAPETAAALNFPSFTITGGSGIYAGASGTGRLRMTLVPGARGKEMWDGTLLVAGLAFDVTAPTLRGAVAKTVVAPRGVKQVRVKYTVYGRDETDGAVRVSCQPPPGSLFKIGRTLVTCSATDKSGNTRSAHFTVTVKAHT